MHLQEIEAVARALYEIQEEARDWHRASERRKEKFREEARAVIAALDEHAKHNRTSRSAQPLPSHVAELKWDSFFITSDKRRKH